MFLIFKLIILIFISNSRYFIDLYQDSILLKEFFHAFYLLATKNEKNKKTQIQHAIRKQSLKIKAKKGNTID